MSRRGRQPIREQGVSDPGRRRPGRGSVERLQQRIRDARANVVAARDAASHGAAAVGQLEQAAADWTHEADRVERDLAVTRRLTGEPRKQALKILTGRVDDLVAVADRFVETAFTEGLLPANPDLDRLRHASERLDALDEAHRELEALRTGNLVRVRSIRVMRLTRLWSQLPGLPRR